MLHPPELTFTRIEATDLAENVERHAQSTEEKRSIWCKGGVQ